MRKYKPEFIKFIAVAASSCRSVSFNRKSFRDNLSAKLKEFQDDSNIFEVLILLDVAEELFCIMNLGVWGVRKVERVDEDFLNTIAKRTSTNLNDVSLKLLSDIPLDFWSALIDQLEVRITNMIT